jgi:type I restriction modification DNA specificity domain protein
MEYVKFSKFIISTQYGYTAKEMSLVEGDAKYLRITDIVPYFVNKEQVPFCKIDDNKKKKYLISENDLLIARTGATTGYNLVVDESYKNFVFASYLIRFNYNKNDLYPLYLKYVLKSQQWYGFVNNFISGSAQPGMNAKVFGKFQIPFFKYDIQKRISNILSTYDKLIENNNKRIKLLEQMTENLYKEWFVRFRFPGYDDMEVEEKKPRGWQVGTEEKKHLVPSIFKYAELGNIGSFVRGKNITAAKMLKGDIPVISAGLQPSGYHNEANVFGENLTISASGANAGYLQYNLNDIWAADCSYYQDNTTIWFVYNTLKYLQPVISNLQCGAAQPHVYPKNINSLCILIPTEELIHKYNDFVKPYYDEIKVLNQHNQLLTQQRDMLLPRLMSGKLEV